MSQSLPKGRPLTARVPFQMHKDTDRCLMHFEYINIGVFSVSSILAKLMTTPLAHMALLSKASIVHAFETIASLSQPARASSLIKVMGFLTIIPFAMVLVSPMSIDPQFVWSRKV